MEQKRKRGRPRKNPLPEEIQNLVNEVKSKQESVEEPKLTKEEYKQNIEWDFDKSRDIEFFDTRYSYELTGYKPITKNKGLDFNPDWFTEARDTFMRTGHYCSYPRNSKAYRDFWNQEYRRCREGMTSHGYTITGDNYFFLNYYQLMDLSSATKAGAGRTYIFPAFYAGQYEWFHYIELARKLRLNACLMKSREIGFSEIDAAIIANSYNSVKGSINLIVAHLSDHLNKTLEKVWKALSFLNDYTDGGFFKLSQVLNKADQKRASHYKIINGQKIETGWMSQITGIVADKPMKIRGDRTDLLIYEEAGSWPGLNKAFIQSDALVGPPEAQWGLRILGGTSGDTGAALEGLRDMYYNPETYGILKFRHNYTQTGEEALTAFFIPCTKIMKDRDKFLEHRGYVDEDKAKEFYDKVRAKKASNPQALVIYSAEYPYTAEEAFSLEGDNKFNKVNIAEQLTKIRALKQCPPIDRGYIEYIYKNNVHIPQNITGFRWIPNDSSPLQILEHPIWTLEPVKDEEGKVVWSPPADKLNNLYVIGIDGIDIGKSQTSEYTKDPSDFCLVVYKRAYGLEEPKFVAVYKDRPNDVRECYKIAFKLMQYYNAKVNIEATRQGIIPHARDQKLLSYFMKRPRATLSESIRNTNKQYGTPATLAIIDHQTDLIADYVSDYCHQIWFESMLDELSRYTDQNKGKFDIVAAMAMALLADEELSGFVPRTVETFDDEWQDIGYYTDSNGIKRYGTIPKKDNITISVNFDTYDDLGIRSSDPRKYSSYV